MRRAYAVAAIIMLTWPALARTPYDGGEVFYRSTDEQMVHRPTGGDNPAFRRSMVTCRDGSSSYSHQGTCSGHGGVIVWR